VIAQCERKSGCTLALPIRSYPKKWKHSRAKSLGQTPMPSSATSLAVSRKRKSICAAYVIRDINFCPIS
jgi:hypothetical protein